MNATGTAAYCMFCNGTCIGACAALANTTLLQQQQLYAAQQQALSYIPYPGIKYPDPPIQSLDPQLLDLIAYRVWNIKDSWLTSVSMETVWLPDKVVSGNVETNEGIHAYKTPEAAVQHLCVQLQRCQHAAVGTVRLWGSVVEHESGYRAEFGRLIEVLDVSIGDPWSAQRHYALKFFQAKYNCIEKESDDDSLS